MGSPDPDRSPRGRDDLVGGADGRRAHEEHAGLENGNARQNHQESRLDDPGDDLYADIDVGASKDGNDHVGDKYHDDRDGRHRGSDKSRDKQRERSTRSDRDRVPSRDKVDARSYRQEYDREPDDGRYRSQRDGPGEGRHYGDRVDRQPDDRRYREPRDDRRDLRDDRRDSGTGSRFRHREEEEWGRKGRDDRERGRGRDSRGERDGRGGRDREMGGYVDHRGGRGRGYGEWEDMSHRGRDRGGYGGREERVAERGSYADHRSKDRDRDSDRGGGYGRSGDREERERGGRDVTDREHTRGARDEEAARRERERAERSALVLGGYKPRHRSGGIVPQTTDPFAAVREKNKAQGMHVSSFEEAASRQKELQAKARQLVLQQQATSAAAAASKTQREVYIGNLQQGKVTEQTLRQLFDEALSSAFPALLLPGVKPCMSVAMHSEGRYAFVELATPEMATAALSLSGQLNFLGSQMTVGRPSGYIDPSKAEAAAAAASKALQEFDMAGVTVANVAPGEALPMCSEVTDCVCIDGMVTPEVFTNEEEYQGMMEDLNEECSKMGPVMEIRIPRPDNADAVALCGTGCYGKVYVCMEHKEDAEKLSSLMHGRIYDGRALKLHYVLQPHFYMLIQNTLR